MMSLFRPFSITGFCFAIVSVLIVASGSGIALGNVAFDAVAKSIVLIDTGDNIGTGFFIASDERRSIILTAQHVIGAKKSVRVYARAGYRGSFVATVMKVDRDRDLALLSVPTGPFPTLPIAASVTIGESVAAGGFDDLAYRYFKSSGDLQPNFHPGSVSSIRGSLVVHDVPTDEGNSGGPLFDVESGDVVGVVKGSFNANYYAAVGPPSIRQFLLEAGIKPGASVAIQATPTPQAIPTVAPTPTPGAAEIAYALSGQFTTRRWNGGAVGKGDFFDYTTTNAVELSSCTFSVSWSEVASGFHGDHLWTGNLRDIELSSVRAGAVDKPPSVPQFFLFSFTPKGGAPAFSYQGDTASGWDGTSVSVFTKTDPTWLLSPFRSQIRRCSGIPDESASITVPNGWVANSVVPPANGYTMTNRWVKPAPAGQSLDNISLGYVDGWGTSNYTLAAVVTDWNAEFLKDFGAGNPVASHAEKVCNGTADGWYFQNNDNTGTASAVAETTIVLGQARILSASYRRLSSQSEDPDARNALDSLCIKS